MRCECEGVGVRFPVCSCPAQKCTKESTLILTSSQRSQPDKRSQTELLMQRLTWGIWCILAQDSRGL